MAASHSRSSKRTVGALRVLLGAAVLVPLLLVGVAALQHRRVLIEEAEQRTAKAAAILGQHTTSSFELYDFVFRRATDFLAAYPQGVDHAALQSFLARLHADLGDVQGVFVLDAKGDMVAHSRFTERPQINASDRDYFIAL